MNQSKQYGSIVVLLFLLLTIPSIVEAQGEKRISVKDLPTAVRSAFEKAYPKAEIKGAAEEPENGVTYYEIESIDGKTHRDLLYTKDGEVHEIEEAMDTASLPEAVSAALEKAYPKCKVRRAEKTTRGSVTDIEVMIQTGKKRHELVFNTNGTVQKDEVITTRSEKKEGNEKEKEGEEDDDDL
jgi:Putative beta-lactamase-inhibitor-like, PepSY-like